MADGSPEVDDLEAVLEQLGNILGRKVTVDARDGGSSRLVNMDLGDWLPLLGRVFNLTRATTTNS